MGYRKPEVITSTYNVDGKRTDAYVETGSSQYPFKTIQAAINKAVADGHTTSTTAANIIVFPGRYTEDISMKDSISVTAANNKGKDFVTIINGQVTYDPQDVNGITHHTNVTLAGFVISADTGKNCINLTGVNEGRIFLRDIWLEKTAGTESCILMNGSNTSRIEADSIDGGCGTASIVWDILNGVYAGTGKHFAGSSTAGSKILHLGASGSANILELVSTCNNPDGDAITIDAGTQTLELANSSVTNQGANSNGVNIGAGATFLALEVGFNVPVGTGKAIVGTPTSNFAHTKCVYFFNATIDTNITTTNFPLTTETGVVPTTTTLHVDNNRTDNYLQTGSVSNPFKTIQAALNVVASIGNRWLIKVAPGVYTENLAFTYDEYLRIDLEAAHIIGTFDWTISSSAVSFKPKCIIVGSDLRAVYPTSSAFHLNCIEGNVSYNQIGGLSKYPSLQFINSGVVGDINVTGPTDVLMHIMMSDSAYTGDINSTSTTGPQAILYAKNSMFSSSASIGGANGQVTLNEGHNLQITRTWNIETPSGGGGGTWTNVQWKTGSNFATNSRPFSGTFNADAVSYKFYQDNVTTKGNETVNPLQDAFNASDVLNDSTVVGAKVSDALDTLKAHETNTSNPHAVSAAQVSAPVADGVAKITVGITEPTSPTIGDIWLDIN